MRTDTDLTENLQSDNFTACMLVSLLVPVHIAACSWQRPAVRQTVCEPKIDTMIHLNSELPPDMDSNQTLTASCRGDMWIGAIFKPQRNETRRYRWK